MKRYQIIYADLGELKTTLQLLGIAGVSLILGGNIFGYVGMFISGERI